MEVQYPGATKELGCTLQDHVARITINRPERKNAVTGAMWEKLAQLVPQLAGDEAVRVIVISGAGGNFSAGADIAEFDTLRGDSASAAAYEAANSHAFAAIRNAAVPVVAAIRGICFGGGFGIAAACDLRFATPDAAFAVPAARLGLAYPADAMADIVDACGSQMARYLTYSAARLDAGEALSAGFLAGIHEPESFDAEITKLAAQIAANAPLSVKASKAAIDAVVHGGKERNDNAERLGARTFASEDYAEGRAAFREKRDPVFKGR